MEQNSQVKLYIDLAKPFYYPGEQFLASILLDVLDKINCNKMIIIAKGKQIIKASQTKIFNETEENANLESDEEDEKEDIKGKNESITEINDSNIFFKYKKIVDISDKNYLKKGKYTFPFEVELPENIPGSFLFLQKTAYVEIIYSIKVKLNNIDIEEKIPIIIRQKEEIFNYQDESEYTKKLGGCCCEVGETKIKLNTIDKFYINGNEIKLNVNINNKKSRSSGSPINVEVYQKLTLKHKNKKIKITKIVGKYKDKKIINPRENYKKNISIPLDVNNYVSEHLSETKSIKYFRHKNIIPLLNQSIKSNSIINEYEIYVESQFSNLSGDELGAFINLLIYPPEKGILSKTISKISQEFSNSIVNNRKIFLNNESLDYDKEFENNKKNKKKHKSYKQEYSEDSASEKESMKHKNNKSNIKVKMIGNNENEDEDDNDNNINNINNNDNELDNSDNNSNNNINENINIHESPKKNHVINDNKKSIINSEEISFGTSTKDNVKLFNAETTSNNIKKNFNQNFLNDPLDDEFMDLDSMK